MYKEDIFLKIMNFVHGKIFSIITLIASEIIAILIMYFNLGIGLLCALCFFAIYFVTKKIFDQP